MKIKKKKKITLTAFSDKCEKYTCVSLFKPFVGKSTEHVIQRLYISLCTYIHIYTHIIIRTHTHIHL